MGEVKAKNVSLAVKICAVAFVLVCSVLKWCGLFPEATIGEICTVGGVIGAIFGDVSINMALDKFRKSGADEK